MTELPPDENSSDDVDERYRRASSREVGRPSESVRRAVLRHAADLAAERASATRPVDIDFKQRAANQAWLRPAAYGGLTAAVLAGLLIAPRFLTPSSPTQQIAKVGTPAPVPAPAAQSADASPAAAQSARAPQDAGAPPAALALAPAPAAKAEIPESPFPGSAAERGASRQDRAGSLTADSSRSSAARSGATGATNAARAEQFGASDSAAAQSAPPPASEPSRSQPGDSVTAGAALTPPASPHASLSMGLARPIDSASALRQAAALGDLPHLRALLAEQPDIDSRDSSGRSALMLAVLYGHADAVGLLLASGADANAADANGTTPLQAALTRNRSDMIEALRRAGAR